MQQFSKIFKRRKILKKQFLR